MLKEIASLPLPGYVRGIVPTKHISETSVKAEGANKEICTAAGNRTPLFRSKALFVRHLVLRIRDTRHRLRCNL
jgi:hypothetical protein